MASKAKTIGSTDPTQAGTAVEDYRRHEAAAVTTGARDATGHESNSFARFAAECAAAFLPTS